MELLLLIIFSLEEISSECALKNSQSLVLGFLYLSGIQMAVKAYQVRFCECVNIFFPTGKCRFLKKSISFYQVLLEQKLFI